MKTSIPFSSRLSLLLAIADAKKAGFHHFDSALSANPRLLSEGGEGK